MYRFLLTILVALLMPATCFAVDAPIKVTKGERVNEMATEYLGYTRNPQVVKEKIITLTGLDNNQGYRILIGVCVSEIVLKCEAPV